MAKRNCKNRYNNYKHITGRFNRRKQKTLDINNSFYEIAVVKTGQPDAFTKPALEKSYYKVPPHQKNFHDVLKKMDSKRGIHINLNENLIYINNEETTGNKTWGNIDFLVKTAGMKYVIVSAETFKKAIRK